MATEQRFPIPVDGGQAVVARGLVRRFGRGADAVDAVDGVDLEVPAGTVFGLLGPNGAGKTTVVRMLTGLLRPTGGTATVAGVGIGPDGVADSAALRARIGLAGQYAGVDELLTARENLRLFGRLGHLTRSSRRARADALLERFDLADAADRPVRTFSGGMRRRLDLASALMTDPQVVFLDEPTTGLDPRSRLALWDVVGELTTAGTTVLLTTQYLDEADRLASSLAVVDAGRVIAQGTPTELKSSLGGGALEISLTDPGESTAALAAVVGLGTGPAVVADQLLRVPVRDPGATLTEVVRRLDRADVSIRGVTVSEPSLDDVFLALTGRAAATLPDATADPARSAA